MQTLKREPRLAPWFDWRLDCRSPAPEGIYRIILPEAAVGSDTPVKRRRGNPEPEPEPEHDHPSQSNSDHVSPSSRPALSSRRPIQSVRTKGKTQSPHPNLEVYRRCPRLTRAYRCNDHEAVYIEYVTDTFTSGCADTLHFQFTGEFFMPPGQNLSACSSQTLSATASCMR